MPMTEAIDSQLLDVGLLLVRLVFGLAFAAHGAQKLFGWFGGYGLAGTGGFMESLGFRPGKTFATAAGLSEFSGGLLLALGFLGPIGPALVLSVMVVAVITVHANKENDPGDAWRLKTVGPERGIYRVAPWSDES